MTRAGSQIGIDANPPLDAMTGEPSPPFADPAILADTNAGWVRLNFALAPWTSPHDETKHGGRTWAEAYRQLIAALRGQGLAVYGLISHEAVARDLGDSLRNPPPEGAAEHAWLRDYVDAFAAIVGLFHDDVQVFESFDEPDDWHGSNRNWVHPGWYAVMLQQVYDAVRAQPSPQQVRLVSGPLQGLAINNNAATAYLQAAYDEGKRRFGWGQNGTPFPFDGAGYHLYVAEEQRAGLSAQELEEELRVTYERYVGGLRRVIREQEGRSKPIYISAIGWHTNRNPEEFQANRLRQALDMALADPSVAMAVWFCLQDFGPADGNRYYGLYRPGPLTPESRKPAYAALQQICARQLPAAGEGAFDNRTLIRAVTLAADELGVERYQLIERSGLWGAFFDRAAAYRGPALDGLHGLSETERSLLAAKLTALRAGSAPRRGETTAASLNLRAGPSTGADILAQLPEHTLLRVLQEDGEWLHVETDGNEGFVHRQFVAIPGEEPPPGFLRSRPALAHVPLAPPAGKLFEAGTVRTPSERRLAFIWNRCGRLLAALADELHIQPAIAAAVAAVESGGYAFAADGRMIIRFENHLFLHHWGRANRARFDEHFALDEQTPWQGHRWRPSPDAAWRPQHQALDSLDANQAAEWETFLFAATLDAHAARLSISMGAPQILGSNHAVIGYESVEQMFDAFAADERAQFVGLFDFIKSSPERVAALQRGDYLTFASLYNGPGQAATYAGLIEVQTAVFNQIVARQDEVSFGAAAGYDIDMAGIPFLPPFWPAPPSVGAGLVPAPDIAPSQSTTPAQPAAPKETWMTNDPLYKAWQQHIIQGLANNNVMFRRTLRAYLLPYYLTVGMYAALFVAGLGLFVAAAWLSAQGESGLSAPLFAGLGAATLLALFIRNPLRSLEENLQFITWLGVIYNTYWTRLLYMQDQKTVHAELEDATGDAIREIERLIDKGAKLAAKRPGATGAG